MINVEDHHQLVGNRHHWEGGKEGAGGDDRVRMEGGKEGSGRNKEERGKNNREENLIPLPRGLYGFRGSLHIS